MSIGVFSDPSLIPFFTTEEMRAIWEYRQTIDYYYQVESALAQAQAKLGIIPPAAAEEITAKAKVTEEMMASILGQKSMHPLVLPLDALRKQLSDTTRGLVHYGITTQDVTDTARALQIKASLGLIRNKLQKLTEKLDTLAIEQANTTMVGRTNGQHAVPITVGLKIRSWLSSLQRSQQRLADSYPRAITSQLSGASGTYAAYGIHGLEIARLMSKNLGLTFEPVPWHCQRDNIAELATNLAILLRNIGKIADDLYDMQRTEIREARQINLNAHLSGSSTMPQKCNPFATLQISSLARMVASSAATLLMQPPGANERDPRELTVEQDALIRAIILSDAGVTQMLKLLDMVEFIPENLRENALIEGPLLVTEGLMMRLAPLIGHQKAHDVLQEYAVAYRENQVALTDFLRTHPVTKQVIADTFFAAEDPTTGRANQPNRSGSSNQAYESFCDLSPESYLGLAPVVAGGQAEDA